MENPEDILDELIIFEKRRPREIPQILEDYLAQIAKTGDTIFPWSKLKPLFMLKMENVIQEFNETCPTDDIIHCSNVERFRFEVMKEKLLEAVDSFNSSAPFTIQRLCELVTSPKKHYKYTDKFMRGLEKNVLVVSTVEPGCSHIYACDCSRKKNENQTAVLNGVTDGNLNGVESFDSYIENKSTTPLSPSSSNNSDGHGNADTTDTNTVIENNKNNNLTDDEKRPNQETTTKIAVEESNGENLRKSEASPTQEKEFLNSDDVVSLSSVDSSEVKISIEISQPVIMESSCKTEKIKSLAEDEVDSTCSEKSAPSDDKEDGDEQQEVSSDSEAKEEPKQGEEAEAEAETETETEIENKYNDDTDKDEAKDSSEDDQPSSSDMQENVSPSLATAIDDDDEAEENQQSSDNDDITVAVHSLDNEAADIDDNTMDVPLSEDSDSSSLNMVTSADTSSNEMQENAVEPMEED